MIAKNILSNLYYFYLLLGNSISFSNEEKIQIFEIAKTNRKKIINYIRILEEEQNKLLQISKNYNKKLIKLGEHYYKDLKKAMEEEKEKQKEKIKNKILNIRKQEKLEKEDLNLILNQL